MLPFISHSVDICIAILVQNETSSMTTVSLTILTRILGKIQRRICEVIGAGNSSHPQTHSHNRDLTSLGFFINIFIAFFSEDIQSFVSRLQKLKSSTRLASRSHNITVEIVECNRKFYSDSFFPRTSLRNSLATYCYPVNENVNKI